MSARLSTKERSALRQLLALLMHPRPALAPGERPSTVSLPLATVRDELLAPQAYRAGYGVFERDYLDARLYARMHQDCLDELSTALADHDIAVVPTGGTLYALRVYEDPALRPLDRIDLLLQESTFADAVRVVERLGYSRVPSGPSTTGAVFLTRKHEEAEASVGLHRAVAQPAGGRFDLAGAWRRARPFDIQTPRVLGFQPIDQLLVHAGFAAHHHLRVPLISWTDGASAFRRVERSALSELRTAGRAARLGPALAVTSGMTRLLAAGGARLARTSAAAALMPTADELVERGPVSTAVRRLREAALLQGPRDLAGLAVSRLGGRGRSGQ